MSMAHRQRIKVDGSVAIISIKNFPTGLHVMYLYFPDMPCMLPEDDLKIETCRSILNVLM
jgi:hypothetical protein